MVHPKGSTNGLYVSAKLGVTKKLAAPKSKLFPCPLKRSCVLRPSVPGTSDVLSSNVRNAVLTFAGMSGRAQAVEIDSHGTFSFVSVPVPYGPI